MNVAWEARAHTASDGYTWAYRHYSAGDTPRARLIYLHGIQSHAGWYEASCSRLADLGFAVDFLDRRGSGVNEASRGDTPSFGRLLDDVAEFLRSLPNDRPKVLLAVSWGGKLAVALHRKHPDLVQGQALLCPGLCPKIAPSIATQVSIATASLVQPGRHYPIPLNDPELFTRTPRWLEFLRQDPLALREATARFLSQSVWLDLYLRRCPRHVRIPTFLLLAGRDAIIDNFKTARFCERFAGPLEVRTFATAHHTLEFEPDGPPFVDDLVWWLERRGLTAG